LSGFIALLGAIRLFLVLAFPIYFVFYFLMLRPVLQVLYDILNNVQYKNCNSWSSGWSRLGANI